MTTTLNYLLTITKNSFNSLGYNDWSTSHQNFPRVKNTDVKTLKANENKVKENS